jgi:acyl-lipid omega-6 desaturase (Delta-12 desaturase)
LRRSCRQAWISAMATNVGIALLGATMIWLVGVGPFLLVQLPITLLAASIGVCVWLFYVQHQFEDTFWAHDEGWNFHDAGLHGSSHYDLPRILRWFTADIGVHHVHHLCSRIPYYRLPQVLRDHPELAAVGRLTLLQSLRCLRRFYGMRGGVSSFLFGKWKPLACRFHGNCNKIHSILSLIEGLQPPLGAL